MIHDEAGRTERGKRQEWHLCTMSCTGWTVSSLLTSLLYRNTTLCVLGTTEWSPLRKLRGDSMKHEQEWRSLFQLT
eukprot:3348509-Amphidinium_carterae.1